ncbi:transmembrane protein 68-like isoform X2 [Mauremys reevesii]|uniref:transmembrane protein 68-like isoform X2 n=1 Tax=Mauremys reevesii TaxID=260615 RepID=UPI00193FD9FF|nr:transmembrane protein 68-like isoform X2 [Mauremys reevesii]
MIHRNESCTSGQVPMSYLCCLIYILEEWTGVEYLEDYLNYVAYLLWVFTPLIIVFILPGLILLLLYISIIFLYVYKRKNELKEAYSNDIWDGARQMVATLWDGHARIWHGFKLLLDVFGVMHGPKEECVKALKNGHLVAISPGGVREALFSDETYVLVWGNRTGFAQVAIDAKVPIIPMFTQNVREGIRTLGGIRLFRLIYERLRLPLVPIYGEFPVKFRTYIGDPIPYDPNINAAELSGKAKAAIQSLIDRHQKIPGNVFRALMERFETTQKED